MECHSALPQGTFVMWRALPDVAKPVLILDSGMSPVNIGQISRSF
jgi:hypothetical protein